MASSASRLADHQRAGAADVKTVHILGRRDRLDDLLRVDVRRQRQLNQDAVNRRVIVQRLDARQQFGFQHVGRVALQHRMQAVVFASLDLVAHIHLAGRAVADQHHGQSRRDAAGAEQRGALGDFGAQLA